MRIFYYGQFCVLNLNINNNRFHRKQYDMCSFINNLLVVKNLNCNILFRYANSKVMDICINRCIRDFRPRGDCLHGTSAIGAKQSTESWTFFPHRLLVVQCSFFFLHNYYFKIRKKSEGMDLLFALLIPFYFYST